MCNLTLCFVRVININEYRILAISLHLAIMFMTSLDGQCFSISSRKRYNFFKKELLNK